MRNYMSVSVRQSKKVRGVLSWGAAAVVFLFMSLLLSCPSAFGYFPDPADRIPTSAIGSNIKTVQEPSWLVRQRKDNGEWGDDDWHTVDTTTTASYNNDIQAYAKSVTFGSSTIYSVAPALPHTNSNSVTKDKPIELSGSSSRQTYTAIAIASQMLPSAFKTITLSIDTSKISTPFFNISVTAMHTSKEALTISTTTLIPGTNKVVPLYYTSTTDGSEPPDPTTSSTLYEGSFDILPNTGDEFKIKVVGIHELFNDSDIVSVTFRRERDMAVDPVISLTGDKVDSPSKNDLGSPQSLTISTSSLAPPDNTDSVAIYYTSTLDGSEPPDPTTSSTLYEGSIDILPNSGDVYRINAIAINDRFENSNIVRRRYERARAREPVISLSGDGTMTPSKNNFTESQTLRISTTPDNAPTYFTSTTDGSEPSDPTTLSTLYESPINILSNHGDAFRIKAIVIISENGRLEESVIVHRRYGRSAIIASSAPAFSISPRADFTTPEALSFSSSLLIPGSTEPVPIYYTSTTDGSEPPDPTTSSQKITTGVSFDILPNVNDIFRVKVAAIHPTYTIVIGEGTFARRKDSDNDGTIDSFDVDDDNNGLIEIRSIEMLNAIRNNLAGTAYTGPSSRSLGVPALTNSTDGGPRSATEFCNTASNSVYLCGYELTSTLDFKNKFHYTKGSVNNDWVANNGDPNGATNAGFEPIGNWEASFKGIFEGNAYAVTNLYSRNTSSGVSVRGLFGIVDGSGFIRNLFVSGDVYGHNIQERIGGVVGRNLGKIQAVGSAVVAHGGNGDDSIGSLAGENYGNITASYATGNVFGDNHGDNVGGLVGYMAGGTMSAVYSKGTVRGGAGNTDNVGGLVGKLSTGGTLIHWAVSTGTAYGGIGDYDSVGGLIGFMEQATSIESTYSMGGAYGDETKDVDHTSQYGSDKIGPLIGTFDTAEYNYVGQNGFDIAIANGDIRNTSAITDKISASYGYGEAYGNNAGSRISTERPNRIFAYTDDDDSPNSLSSSSGNGWDSPGWDFGNSSQSPALRYADYDGADGGTFPACSIDNGGFPSMIPAPAPSQQLVCGSNLLGSSSIWSR